MFTTHIQALLIAIIVMRVIMYVTVCISIYMYYFVHTTPCHTDKPSHVLSLCYLKIYLTYLI